MNTEQLSALLAQLLSLSKETEWVEWKHNNCHPEMIAERISALANSAALHGESMAYMLWGIEDASREVLGTTFSPKMAKKGNEELEVWLMRSQVPQVSFKMYEWNHEGLPLVLIAIPPATDSVVRFGKEAFVRIGSTTKKLSDFPKIEAELWAKLSSVAFEEGIARQNVTGPESLDLLDYQSCFDLLGITLPSDQKGTLSKLVEESLLVERPGGKFDITNLGAILFAKNLGNFDRLARKALRIIKYVGEGRIEIEREWRDAPAQKGYAVMFEAAVAFVNSQLPQNEPVGQALSQEIKVYPEIAVRELVANALIHQDFSVTGTGPMVEIFPSRLEISNPGEPLVDTLRFIDARPKSRNEALASLMRRMRICEEAGTGIDKVVSQVEVFQLPAPDFRSTTEDTTVLLFGPRSFSQMGRDERIRACYQHAVLMFLSGTRMTNASLRKRLGIKDSNYPTASRILKDTLEIELIKPQKGGHSSPRSISYLPIWA